MSDNRRTITESPENSETPLDEVRGWVTPNRLFFVRNHFDVPAIDRSAWRLEVAGLVDRSLSLDWQQIEALPQRSVCATMECAGNGRSFLERASDGVQWGPGAIGHAEWSGTPLNMVLQQAGPSRKAIEVVCEGADRGREKDHPGEIAFARSLPWEKAIHPDTLLATRMNGDLLEPNHGAPVRLLVPGWCGVASVKWLTRLEIVDRPFQGYYQTRKYTVARRTGRGIETEMIGVMPVKSEIIRPRSGATLGIGNNHVFGLAWAGEDDVAAVEISFDGGVSWASASLLGPRAAYSWCLWEYLWEVAAPGKYTLLSRAISASGQIQPARHDPLCGGYLVHFSRPLTIHVDAARRSSGAVGSRNMLLSEMHALAEERSQLRLDVELELTQGAGI